MGRRDLHARGNRGELWAARALRAAGYRILARRWRIPGGEIDLIAEDGDGYAFVEVKTRQDHRFGSPEAAVGRRKLARLHRAAEQWLADEVGDAPVAWRVDVVAVEMDAHQGALPRRITIFRYFEV
ncbi:MAG: YraN family protein [Ardenticatenales bacterium]|nr:YraN family protein [Ardenticatenales bacterium]